jgi:hypothetical protein
MVFSRLFGQSSHPAKRRRRQSQTWLHKEGLKALKDKDGGILARVRDSPIVQAAVISEATGIPITAKDIPTTTPEEKLEAQVMEEVLAEAAKDPEYREEVKAATLDRIRWANMPGGRRSRRRFLPGGDDEDFPPGFLPGAYGGYDPSNPLSIIDMYREFESKFKDIKPDIFSKMFPNGLDELIKLIPGFLGKGNGHGPDMVAIEIDGEYVEVSRQAYIAMKRQRARLKAGPPPLPGSTAPLATVPAPVVPTAPVPVAAAAPASAPAAAEKPAAPAPVAPAAAPVNTALAENKESSPEVDPGEEEALPESINLNEKVPAVFIKELEEFGKRIVEGIDKKPEEFTQALSEAYEAGDPNAGLVWRTLVGTADFADLVKNLSRFKGTPELKPYIEKLEQNKDWGEAVIKKVKELDGETSE